MPFRPSLRSSRGVSTAAASMLATAVVATCLPADAAEGRRADAPLARLALSAEVAAWGREAKDPVALIVAAEIRSHIGSRPVDRRPEDPGDAAAAAAPAELGVDGLLAEARALARGDATIAALADDVKGSATKGLVQGAGSSRATVRPAGTDWYRKLKFEGARYAETYVELAGPGTVSVSVFDDKGNLVCRDPNPSAVAYCGWTPSATGTFDLRVENRSNAAVPYRLFTN